jgi:hypothetical protein
LLLRGGDLAAWLWDKLRQKGIGYDELLLLAKEILMADPSIRDVHVEDV